MSEQRGSWYLLTGLVLGAVLGLVYARLLSPVRYFDSSPAALHPQFKDTYRALIAAAYAATGDLVRARARLELLGDPDPVRAVAGQAQRSLAGGNAPAEASALGSLALALGQPAGSHSPTSPPGSGPAQEATPTESANPPGAALTPTEGIPSPNPGAPASPTAGNTPVTITAAPGATPFDTPTLLPTRTATPTPGSPFVLQSRELFCDPELPEALIQVLAYDAAGQPVPGVEVMITWQGGEEHFFTGLKPELSLGYADFAMTPGTVYTLRLAEGGQPIADLSAAECEGGPGGRYYGAWRLVFSQP